MLNSDGIKLWFAMENMQTNQFDYHSNEIMGESCFPYKSIQQNFIFLFLKFTLSRFLLLLSHRTPRSQCHIHARIHWIATFIFIHCLRISDLTISKHIHSIICRRFNIYSIACCQMYEHKCELYINSWRCHWRHWYHVSALLRFIDLVRMNRIPFTKNICIWLHKSIPSFVQTSHVCGTFDACFNQIRFVNIASFAHNLMCSFVIYWPAFTTSEMYCHLAIEYRTQSKCFIITFFPIAISCIRVWMYRIRKFRQSFYNLHPD